MCIFCFVSSYKATITNVQMIYLGAKLHRLLSDDTNFFFDIANRTWHWMRTHELIDPRTGLVADALNVVNCTGPAAVGWTYQQGVLVGGLAEMALLMTDTESRKVLLSQAMQLVDAVRKHLTTPSGVLMENCDAKNGADGCNVDQNMYKGLFMRNLRYVSMHKN